MIKKIFLPIVSVMVMACNKGAEENVPELNTPFEGVKEGKYHFSSKESLTTLFEKLKDDQRLFEKTMKDLYKQGFRPMSPVGDIEKDAELEQIFNPKGEQDTELDHEITEEKNPVADPILSAFLDENGEIVVKDTLYHFTSQRLFFSHLNEKEKLQNFIKNLKEEDIFLSEEEVLHKRNQASGKLLVTDGVFEYVQPLSDLEKEKLTPKTAAYRTDVETINTMGMSLPERKPSRNWWLHRLFGNTQVATEHFDARRRVKIEYWKQNYRFYASTGISVRNQTRRLRIWWRSSADEIVIGANYMYFKYQMPSIQVTPQLPQFTPSFQQTPTMYAYKGNIYHDTYYNRPISNIRLESIKLPFFKFDNAEILNIYIPNLVDITYSVSDILSQSNIKQLYQQGIDFLKKQASGDKPFVVQRELFPAKELEVMYLNILEQRQDDNNVHKYFRQDWGGQAGYSFTPTAPLSGKPGGIVPLPDHLAVKQMKADFYGMARRGGIWKGVRMVIE